MTEAAGCQIRTPSCRVRRTRNVIPTRSTIRTCAGSWPSIPSRESCWEERQNLALEAGGKGYGGRYPGVVEEAWRTLEAGKPLYVVGGFGGAAALVADLLESDAIPDRLQDKTWNGSTYFAQNAKAIDDDPYRQKLGLPERMEDLAKAVSDLAKPLLASDAAALKWNGLTVDENRRLLRTRDPVLIASLVLQGLLNVARDHGKGKLEIELVQGSVTAASNLDAVAVGVFDKIPLGGAGAALDLGHWRTGLRRASGRADADQSGVARGRCRLVVPGLARTAG